EERVTGVVVSKVDEHRNPIIGEEMHFDCDTVLFSVGLIPENELTKEAGVALSPKTRGATVSQTRETDVDGIFACGNVLQVHDLVDFVSEEAEVAGRYAAKYVLEGKSEREYVDVESGNNLSYVCPQRIDKKQNGNVKLFFRVTNIFKNAMIRVKSGEKILLEKKKKIVAPGEMETLVLSESKLSGLTERITVSLEVES
ncbi:MAG: FAD-dependent oxidoreductase, partial [Clostridia bacterium]|nr:FAD-dependent oxidoreductase [Clostridia bacterium]